VSKLRPEPAEVSDPCPEYLNFDKSSMTDEIFRQWLSIREMSCGPRVFFDRITGQPLTDAEILDRVFNGSTPVSVVPLSEAFVFLFMALITLWLLRRRKKSNAVQPS
jgi:hypothetical protein